MKQAQKPLARGEHRAAITVVPPPPLTEAPEGALTLEHNVTAIDQETRLGLIEYKQKHNLTNRTLGRMLGFNNSTIVSRYLNNKPSGGDYLRFQANGAELLRTAKSKVAPDAGTATSRDASDLWTTPVSQRVHGVLEVIRQTNDFALVHGDAGVGKTCALALYVEANPATVLITAAERCADAGALIRTILVAERIALTKAELRVEALLERFKGSDRLVIVDNAQRLQRGALAWLFDFHDATGCPVALVGNPQVLDKIRDSDQFFSRVGLAEAVSIGTTREAEQFARQMIAKRLDPDLVSELGAEATERILKPGHGRALSKQLNLTRVLRHSDGFNGDARKAFAAAAGKLVLMDGGAK